MDITITIPDEIVDLMDQFRATQFTEEDQPKYTDLSDMCQQHLEAEVFKQFAMKVKSPLVESLRAQLAEAEAVSVVVMPSQARKAAPDVLKDPVVRVK